jgi:Heme/copper-type cytochrome/quinol oxidases, subunit 1
VFTTFTPLLALGYLGLPRRRAAYPAEFEVLQQLATFGAVLLIIGLGIWALNMFQSFRVGPKVTDADVWNLKETDQFSVEWRWFEQRLADKREASSTAPADNSGDATRDPHADGGSPGDGSQD